MLDPLVVVVDGHRKLLFSPFLADHVLIQFLLDLPGLGNPKTSQILDGRNFGLSGVLLNNLVAYFDADIADIHPGPSEDLLHLAALIPSAKGATLLIVFVHE